jgi:thiol:disulfide interchange protein DsbD
VIGDHAFAAPPGRSQFPVTLTRPVLALLLLLTGGLAPAHASLVVPEGAFAEGAFDGEDARVEARLLVHPDDPVGSVGSDSAGVRAGVLLDLDPGWHVYARDPGESGLPTELHWRVGSGSAQDLPWPAPRTYRDPESGLTTFGYPGRVLLPARIRLEPGARKRALAVDVRGLACRTQCIPLELSLARELGTGGAPSLRADADAVRALFAGGAVAAAASAPPTSDGTSARRTPSLLAALGLALLGGLVLNLMPCVLPVLAMKAFAVAELARATPSEARRHGIAYAGGVLSTLLALAACVVGLRQAGASVGWGFQFQEPLFLAVLVTVLVLFAANLFGVFEIGTGAARLAGLGAGAQGARRSFFEGLLAVVLATPCSAPFLGSAVGFAFASDAATTFAVFAAIGAGLAAPFVAVSFVPSAGARLPRPGPWMLRLREALGLGLLATVGWLLWIGGRSAGVAGITALLAVAWCAALVAWVHGRLGPPGFAWLRRVSWVALVPAVLLGANVIRVEPTGSGRSGALASAEAWSPARVDEELANGRIAFVVFTADWCLTCKVNEKLVLASDRVQAELARLDVAVFRLGRAGVPTWALHRPGRAVPDVLPELLSPGRLVAALRGDAAHVVAEQE